jgi:hypothetical protein
MTKVWLAAHYHFPATYSCRIPMSSANHATVTPAPGPATVRLALIRTAIELFGLGFVRDTLFPSICSLRVLIKPPERVAITSHRLRALKWEAGEKGKQDRVLESVVVREIAHAQGHLIVYLEVPLQEEVLYRQILQTIGYWGQTSSFAYCIEITHEEPQPGTYAIPLSNFGGREPLQPLFLCLLTEFRKPGLTWQEIDPAFHVNQRKAFHLDIYVWPMIVERKQNGSQILVHRRLE